MIAIRETPEAYACMNSAEILDILAEMTYRHEYSPNCPSRHLVRLVAAGKGSLDGEHTSIKPLTRLATVKPLWRPEELPCKIMPLSVSNSLNV